MFHENVLNLHQSRSVAAPAPAFGITGSWKLLAGRAITLRPREPGQLRATHGGIWLTGGSVSGDHFIGHGQGFALRAGEEVVIEPWNPGQRAASSYFSWEPQAAAQMSASSRRQQALEADLHGLLDDLRAAVGGLRAPLALALAAALRLARGVAVAGFAVVAGGLGRRPRVLAG